MVASHPIAGDIAATPHKRQRNDESSAPLDLSLPNDDTQPTATLEWGNLPTLPLDNFDGSPQLPDPEDLLALRSRPLETAELPLTVLDSSGSLPAELLAHDEDGRSGDDGQAGLADTVTGSTGGPTSDTLATSAMSTTAAAVSAAQAAWNPTPMLGAEEMGVSAPLVDSQMMDLDATHRQMPPPHSSQPHQPTAPTGVFSAPAQGLLAGNAPNLASRGLKQAQGPPKFGQPHAGQVGVGKLLAPTETFKRPAQVGDLGGASSTAAMAAQGTPEGRPRSAFTPSSAVAPSPEVPDTQPLYSLNSNLPHIDDGDDDIARLRRLPHEQSQAFSPYDSSADTRSASRAASNPASNEPSNMSPTESVPGGHRSSADSYAHPSVYRPEPQRAQAPIMIATSSEESSNSVLISLHASFSPRSHDSEHHGQAAADGYLETEHTNAGAPTTSPLQSDSTPSGRSSHAPATAPTPTANRSRAAGQPSTTPGFVPDSQPLLAGSALRGERARPHGTPIPAQALESCPVTPQDKIVPASSRLTTGILRTTVGIDSDPEDDLASGAAPSDSRVTPTPAGGKGALLETLKTPSRAAQSHSQQIRPGLDAATPRRGVSSSEAGSSFASATGSPGALGNLGHGPSAVGRAVVTVKKPRYSPVPMAKTDGGALEDKHSDGDVDESGSVTPPRIRKSYRIQGRATQNPVPRTRRAARDGAEEGISDSNRTSARPRADAHLRPLARRPDAHLDHDAVADVDSDRAVDDGAGPSQDMPRLPGRARKRVRSGPIETTPNSTSDAPASGASMIEPKVHHGGAAQPVAACARAVESGFTSDDLGVTQMQSREASRVCVDCGTTVTTTWRLVEDDGSMVCNKCHRRRNPAVAATPRAKTRPAPTTAVRTRRREAHAESASEGPGSSVNPDMAVDALVAGAGAPNQDGESHLPTIALPGSAAAVPTIADPANTTDQPLTARSTRAKKRAAPTRRARQPTRLPDAETEGEMQLATDSAADHTDPSENGSENVAGPASLGTKRRRPTTARAAALASKNAAPGMATPAALQQIPTTPKTASAPQSLTAHAALTMLDLLQSARILQTSASADALSGQTSVFKSGDRVWALRSEMFFPAVVSARIGKNDRYMVIMLKDGGCRFRSICVPECC
nr:hypothetical protein HK105_006764 [Polyrhizophydium stewartii]